MSRDAIYNSQCSQSRQRVTKARLSYIDIQFDPRNNDLNDVKTPLSQGSKTPKRQSRMIDIVDQKHSAELAMLRSAEAESDYSFNRMQPNFANMPVGTPYDEKCKTPVNLATPPS